MELYIFIPMTIILFLMSWSDLKSKIIPHSLTIALLILGIINACIDENFKMFNWILFGVFSIIFVITFYIFDKIGKPIGGGDIKLICISFLFLTHTSQYMTYFIMLCIFNFWSMIVGFTFKGKVFFKSVIKYGPYLSLALISTSVLYFIVNIHICIFIILLFTLIFLILEFYYHIKEVLIDVKIFEK